MRKKYIYILSQRYSGSTLLSFLLGTHPDISTIGERRKFYSKSIKPRGDTGTKCSCGQLFKDCDYWNTIKIGLADKLHPNDLNTNFTEFQLLKSRPLNLALAKILNLEALIGWPVLHRLFSEKIERLCRANKLLVEEILHLDGNTAFLDASKTISHLPFLTRLPDFDFYIIWLARDPRAQVSSALKYNKWSVEKAALRWKKEMEANRQLLHALKLNYTELRYESLCSDPRGEMTRLLDFTGLDSSAFSLDFRKPTQHIMGNGAMRLGKDRQIEERKDWKQRLTEEDVKTIERLTEGYRQYYSA